MGGRMEANGGSRRMEDGVQMPVLTSRNSKRRCRVDSGVQRSRQREFVRVGADNAPDTVTQERCREEALASRRKQSIAPTAEAVFSRREARPTTKNARTWKDVGINRRTE